MLWLKLKDLVYLVLRQVICLFLCQPNLLITDVLDALYDDKLPHFLPILVVDLADFDLW